MEIVKVDTKELMDITVKIADEVWREYYGQLLSVKQIDYMLEKFQSLPALTNQISKENYKYFLMKDDKNSLEGYFAIVPKEDHLFLSKIYIRKESRGRGFAKQSIAFIKDFAKALKLSKITLTVNRGNENSIKAYQKIGFEIIEKLDADIGQGFVMDDYKMSLKI